MKKTYQGKKLFLCSSFADVAGLLNIFEKNLKGKMVTFIPTASKVEKINFYVKDAKKELEKAGMIIDILDISQAEKSDIVKKIKNKEEVKEPKPQISEEMSKKLSNLQEIFKNLKIKTKVKSKNLILEFSDISQVEEFIAKLK